MTPEQQTKAALSILKPPPHLRSAVQEEVLAAIAEINIQCANTKPPSKRIRVKLKMLLAALQRCQTLADELSQLDVYWSLFKLDLSKPIARVTRQLSKPAGPKRRSADRQKLAVAHARYLISEFGDEKDLAVTRKNAWHQLAAVLYGDQRIDLFRHMQVTKAAARPDPGQK